MIKLLTIKWKGYLTLRLSHRESPNSLVNIVRKTISNLR
jgi:hypothetical protein